MIRVLLVDDQQLVREGLRRILHPEEGFEIAGECGDGGEVAEAVARLHPDLVVMDVRMKEVDGVEATRRLREEPGHLAGQGRSRSERTETCSGRRRRHQRGEKIDNQRNQGR